MRNVNVTSPPVVVALHTKQEEEEEAWRWLNQAESNRGCRNGGF